MQTSVSAMSEAIEGLLADNTRRKDCAARRNAEASAGIPFGRMLARGSAESESKLLAAVTDAMDGISVFGQSFSKPDELDTDGLQPDACFDALQRGRIYVAPAADVALSDGVHVRMVAGADPAAEPSGQFSPALTTNPLVYADKVFTAANGTEIFTAAAHGLSTGDGPFQVSNAGGALPAGLAALTDYYVIKIDANTFYLATSRALALAGTHLLISDNGTGTQTISDTGTTARVTSMNLSKLARWTKPADISELELAVVEIDMTKIALASLG